MVATLRTPAPDRHRRTEPTPARRVVPRYDTAGGTTPPAARAYAEDRERAGPGTRRPRRRASMAVRRGPPAGVRGRGGRLGAARRRRDRRGGGRRPRAARPARGRPGRLAGRNAGG